MKRMHPLQGFVTQTLVSGAVALLALALALLLAAQLGVRELGEFAGWLAWSLILWPLAAFRIETRVSVCRNEADLKEVVSATCTACLSFLICGSLFAMFAVWIFDVSWSALAIPATASSYALIDLSVNASSFCGKMRISLLLRSLRQVAPFLTACGSVCLMSSGVSAFLGYAVSSIALAVCSAIFLFDAKFAFGKLVKVFIRYRKGLVASMALGVANAVWLNGFIPFLNYFGLQFLAGQYSLVQRILSSPLGILNTVINAYMLRSGNSLHKQPGFMVLSVLSLVIMSLGWVGFVYFGVMTSSLLPIPNDWVVDGVLYWAAGVFAVSSFAVGALALVAIRLADEYFLAVWQVIFIVVGGLILCWSPTAEGLIGYLLIGGVSYWILFVRWIYLARKCRD